VVAVEVHVDIRSGEVPFTRVTKGNVTSELKVKNHQPPFLTVLGRGSGR
jgi:hypothetical protein